MSEPKRLFFAIDLPDEARAQIIAWRAVHFASEDGRPVAAANLHLTLAFLGNVSNDKQRALAQLAGRIRQPGFTLHLNDAGQWLRSRVVWLGMRQPPRGLLQLANMCARRPPAAVVTKARSLFTRILRCCATPAMRWLSRRRAFAGHSRSRRLRFTPLRMGRAAPAMPSYSAGRWANNHEGISMLFSPPLQRATLIQRYKRFLADVITPDGTALTLHCPNTGAMTGCATPGDTVWYSTSENTKRKYPHTWELTETQSGAFICVNTLWANRLTKEAIQANRLPALAGYNILKSEVKYGAERSRIDFMLQADFRPDCYIEVKSVTLAEKENGYFPDAITERGQKHLRELMGVAAAGHRAVVLFAVLHSAITRFSPARHIDIKYAQLLSEAQNKGVEVLAYKAELSATKMELNEPVPITL